MNERTDWFPPEVKPVHSGIYVKHNTSSGLKFFARFETLEWRSISSLTRGVWYMGSIDYQEALNEDTPVPWGFREWPWQGLKEPA